MQPMTRSVTRCADLLSQQKSKNTLAWLLSVAMLLTSLSPVLSQTCHQLFDGFTAFVVGSGMKRFASLWHITMEGGQARPVLPRGIGLKTPGVTIASIIRKRS